MDPPRLGSGARLGQYEIVAVLGEGGMGVVYDALHTQLREPVAVKVLDPRLVKSEVARERLMREGRAAARARHPHIVRVRDAGVEDGLTFLVMDRLEGRDLADHLRHEAPMAPADAVDLILPVAAALASAEEQGVVHRDLKPSNIFVTRTPGGAPFPVVLDFGISKLLDATEGLTRTAEMLGTPGYMAPEQIEEARTVDGRADQYALGVILYECVTGQPAFGRSGRPLVILHAVSEGDFVKPRALAPGLPASLERTILRCMARKPEDRFRSMLTLADALLEHASPAGRARWAELDPRGSGPVTAAPVASAAAPKRSIPWVTIAGGVSLLVSVGLAVSLLVAPPPAAPAPADYPVQVTVTPAQAEIVLDGRVVGRGSMDERLPRDGREHTLLVRAEGYDSFEATFRDDAPPAEVALTPIDAPEELPPPPRAPRRRPEAPADPESDPAPGGSESPAEASAQRRPEEPPGPEAAPPPAATEPVPGERPGLLGLPLLGGGDPE